MFKLAVFLFGVLFSQASLAWICTPIYGQSNFTYSGTVKFNGTTITNKTITGATGANYSLEAATGTTTNTNNVLVQPLVSRIFPSFVVSSTTVHTFTDVNASLPLVSPTTVSNYYADVITVTYTGNSDNTLNMDLVNGSSYYINRLSADFKNKNDVLRLANGNFYINRFSMLKGTLILENANLYIGGSLVLAGQNAVKNIEVNLIGNNSLHFNGDSTLTFVSTTGASNNFNVFSYRGQALFQTYDNFAFNKWELFGASSLRTNNGGGASDISLSGNILSNSTGAITLTKTVLNGAILTENTVSVGAGSILNFGATELSKLQALTGCTATVVALNSFEVTAPPTGSTCGTPPSMSAIPAPLITVKALDSLGKVVPNFTGSITLSTSDGHGNWALATGSGVLTAGAGDSGLATYQFVASDGGMAEFYLSNSHADNLIISVAEPSLAKPSESSPIQFLDNTFVLSNNAITIAGKPNLHTLSLYKKDTTSGMCSVATEYASNAPKSLKIWIARDGDDPSGLAPSISGVSLPNAEPSTSNISLVFSAGVSTFSLNTSDVGKFTVYAKDMSGFSNTSAVIGNGSLLTFKPYVLALSDIKKGVILNPSTTTAIGSAFIPSGDTFSASIGGYLWSSTSDVNNDGVPDVGKTFADVSASGLAPAFKWNTSLYNTTPYFPSTPLDLPAGSGVAGSLTYSPVLQASYTSGKATVNDLSYSEVGSFTLSGSISNYLNSAGVDFTVFNPTVVGRFYPASFEILASPIVNRVNAACVSPSVFTYMDEPIGVNLVVTAKNALGNKTMNYVGDYAKFDPNLSANWGIKAKSGTTDLSTRISFVSSSGAWVDGELAGELKFAFDRNANPDGPYQIEAGLLPVDSDGVSSSVLTMDYDSNGTLESFSLGTSEVRFGRMKISNSFGSDLLPLVLPVHLQYFNNFGFTKNTDDSCTPILDTNVALSGFTENLQAGEVVVGAVGVVSNGTSYVKLNKPVGGDGNYAGSVVVEYDLLTAGLPFLQGRWTGSVPTYSENPKAKATFAKQKSKNRIIHIQEIY